MNEEEIINYFEDCFLYLIAQARESKKKAEKSKDPFEEGVALGYYQAISHLINQAEVFDIKDKIEVIKNYNPDELLGNIANE